MRQGDRAAILQSKVTEILKRGGGNHTRGEAKRELGGPRR